MGKQDNFTFIVTGATGHLGIAVLHALSKTGNSIKLLCLPNEDLSQLENLPVERIIYGDVRNKKSIEALFDGTDGKRIVFIHIAGVITIETAPQKILQEVNVGGTSNVIDVCLEKRVEKLIYVSSVHAIKELPHGKVISEINHFDSREIHGQYAKSKAMATQLVINARNDGLNTVVVHPSGICGPYDVRGGYFTQLVNDFINNKLKTLVRGAYDFVDTRDVADGIVKIALNDDIKNTNYILSNKSYEITEIINTLSDVVGKPTITRIIPMWLAKITAPFAELWYKIRKRTPLYTSYSLYTLTSNSSFSNEKAKRELGFSPRSLRESLKDTVEFLYKRKKMKLPTKA